MSVLTLTQSSSISFVECSAVVDKIYYILWIFHSSKPFTPNKEWEIYGNLHKNDVIVGALM